MFSAHRFDHGRAHFGGKPMEAFVGERQEDVVLAGVVAVNRCGGCSDAFGDLSDGDVGVAFDEKS